MQDILSKISLGEGQTTEFKLSFQKEVIVSVVAFSNAKGGKIFIGVFDNRIEFFNPGKLYDDLTIEKLQSGNYSSRTRNRAIARAFKEAGIIERYGSGIARIKNECKAHGVIEPKSEFSRNVLILMTSTTKDKLKHNIEPSCLGLFDVIVEKRDNKDIIKIIVASGKETPYYIKKYGMSTKGCFIRLGSASEPMNSAMIENLFSRRTRNSLGKIQSNRQDLTFAQLKIYYEAQGLKLNEKFASNLELLTNDGKFNYVAYFNL
jgi:predicted HTH transcriptional regulator